MRHALGAMILLAASAGARADGAFPDSFTLFVPSDQASSFFLATNFGLVVSTDDAGTWHYVCENAIISFATLYAQGPDDAIYAVSNLGLVTSKDLGCTWQSAGGSLTLSAAYDVFPDPSDGMHVLAIAKQIGDSGVAEGTALFESRDGGLSFGAPIYSPGGTRELTGVEISKSDPLTIYLTMYDNGPHPYVVRSTDGGAHFSELDISAVGNRFPRLIGVDKTNPQRLYLRLGGNDGDALGISDDGGMTVRMPLTVPGQMTAFLLRANGNMLVGSNSDMAFRSTDGGNNFAEWPVTLHLRGLGERAGRLYAVGDDVLDDGALFASDDEMNFSPILQFRDILGPATCGNVQSVCAIPWVQLGPIINPNFDGGLPDLSVADPGGGGGGGGCGMLPSSAVGLLPLVCILLILIRRGTQSS